MPQMSPMNWFMLFFMFNFMFYSMLSKLYFLARMQISPNNLANNTSYIYTFNI